MLYTTKPMPFPAKAEIKRMCGSLLAIFMLLTVLFLGMKRPSDLPEHRVIASALQGYVAFFHMPAEARVIPLVAAKPPLPRR